jgi:phospholipase/carboxylesterase
MSILEDFTHVFVPGDDDAPPLLVLHGTGGDEQDLLPLARMISPDSPILSPRGRVLENGMPRFFRRVAEGVFDLDDLKLRTSELAAFILAAAEEYGFDASRLIALGYSNGANIAASLMLTRADVLGGGILLRAMVPFEPESLPDLSGKPVLLLAGEQDPIIPQALTRRLAELLTAAGADVTLTWYPTGHGLTNVEIRDATAWMRERVMTGSPERR